MIRAPFTGSGGRFFYLTTPLLYAVLMKLGLVGGGRAAWAFGSNWIRFGTIAGITLRSSASASRNAGLLGVPVLSIESLIAASDVVLVAVTDRALPEVAKQLAGIAPASVVLLHPSGSWTSEVFGTHANGGSLHPLRSLPPVGHPVDLRGTRLIFEGSRRALQIAEWFTSQSGASLAQIEPAQKPLYHAAAVFASNYVAVMLSTASELLREAGLPAESWKEDLALLAISAIRNWSEQTGSSQFTGPLVRGDLEVVAQHLEALSNRPELAGLYAAIARQLISELIENDRNRNDLRILLDRLSPPAVP